LTAEEKKLITVKELAQEIGASDLVLKKHIKFFEIPNEKIKKRIHIDEKAIEIIKEVLALKADGKRNKEIKQIFDDRKKKEAKTSSNTDDSDQSKTETTEQIEKSTDNLERAATDKQDSSKVVSKTDSETKSVTIKDDDKTLNEDFEAKALVAGIRDPKPAAVSEIDQTLAEGNLSDNLKEEKANKTIDTTSNSSTATENKTVNSNETEVSKASLSEASTEQENTNKDTQAENNNKSNNKEADTNSDHSEANKQDSDANTSKPKTEHKPSKSDKDLIAAAKKTLESKPIFQFFSDRLTRGINKTRFKNEFASGSEDLQKLIKGDTKKYLYIIKKILKINSIDHILDTNKISDYIEEHNFKGFSELTDADQLCKKLDNGNLVPATKPDQILTTPLFLEYFIATRDLKLADSGNESQNQSSKKTDSSDSDQDKDKDKTRNKSKKGAKATKQVKVEAIDDSEDSEDEVKEPIVLETKESRHAKNIKRKEQATIDGFINEELDSKLKIDDVDLDADEDFDLDDEPEIEDSETELKDSIAPRKIRRKAFSFRYIQRQIANDTKRINYLKNRIKRAKISSSERLDLEDSLERRVTMLNGWLQIQRWVKS
jgi:hypothetical protein